MKKFFANNGFAVFLVFIMVALTSIVVTATRYGNSAIVYSNQDKTITIYAQNHASQKDGMSLVDVVSIEAVEAIEDGVINNDATLFISGKKFSRGEKIFRGQFDSLVLRFGLSAEKYPPGIPSWDRDGWTRFKMINP